MPNVIICSGADRGALAIAGQVDRCYPRAARIKFFGFLPIKVSGFYYSNGKKAFGHKLAQKLYSFHVLQAGAFAIRGDAPHWARWQELVLQAVKRGKVFTAEQLCLGVLCYLEGYKLESLPAWVQWLTDTPPLMDTDTNTFVEPCLPHHKIGILHLSGYDQMRRHRDVTTTLTRTDGTTYIGSLRVPDYNGETDEMVSMASTEPVRSQTG